MLKGKKVTLRPVRRSDLKLFLEWFNDQDVIQYLSAYLPMTEMGEEKWIEDLEKEEKKVIFVIETKEEKKPIGTCGLQEIDYKNQRADFGISIGEKDFWSKGYGTEATMLIIDYGFSQLNLNRISSAAFGFNTRSRNLHKKLGFKEEGCRRQNWFRNGKFQDDIMFGLLREDWINKKASP